MNFRDDFWLFKQFSLNKNTLVRKKLKFTGFSHKKATFDEL